MIEVFNEYQIKKYAKPENLSEDGIKHILNNAKSIVDNDEWMLNDTSLDAQIYAERQAIVMCQVLFNEVQRLKNKN